MAKKIEKRKSKLQKGKPEAPFNIYWGRKNYIALFAGLLITIIGFYFMAQGSWDSFPSLYISPILLFIGYLLIIPGSIFLREKQVKAVQQQTSPVVSQSNVISSPGNTEKQS